MTEREQAMYHRLTSTLPNKPVLAQVSFGALLKCTTRSERNTYDRKIADFVVCDMALQPIAIIELDDASHANKREQDRARDNLLIAAGYRVLRYAQIPDGQQLITDISQP